LLTARLLPVPGVAVAALFSTTMNSPLQQQSRGRGAQSDQMSEIAKTRMKLKYLRKKTRGEGDGDDEEDVEWRLASRRGADFARLVWAELGHARAGDQKDPDTYLVW
jgi:hypothetical protein